MTEQRPLFTVVVPVYNHEQYIGAALDSLIAQADCDWEAVVVDDGSTDGTAGIIDRYAREDDRFRVVHKANGGQASALNAGVKEAKGEWICWLSSDDLFEADKLTIHREWINKHPDCRFFFTDFKTLVDETGEINEDDSFGAIPENREWYVITLLEFVYINGISICVNQEVFAKVGLFNENYRYAQDYDLYMRAFVHFPPVHMPVRTCVMRSHAGQYTVTHEGPMFFQCAQAAIDFVNNHTFDEMFPLTDLSDPAAAAAVIDRALDVAMGAHCFLQGLGAHPGLFARIIDWVEDLPVSNQWRPIRNAVSTRLRAGSIAHEGTAIGQVCAASSLRFGQAGFGPAHRCISPVEVARGLYFRLLRDGDEKGAILLGFLEQHFGVVLPEESVAPEHARRVLLTGREGDGQLTETAALLVEKGHSVAVAEIGGYGLTMRQGAVAFGSADKFSTVLSLMSLPPFDVVVLAGPAGFSRWPVAAHERIPLYKETGSTYEVINSLAPIGVLARGVRHCLAGIARARRVVRRSVGQRTVNGPGLP